MKRKAKKTKPITLHERFEGVHRRIDMIAATIEGALKLIRVIENRVEKSPLHLLNPMATAMFDMVRMQATMLEELRRFCAPKKQRKKPRKKIR